MLLNLFQMCTYFLKLDFSILSRRLGKELFHVMLLWMTIGNLYHNVPQRCSVWSQSPLQMYALLFSTLSWALASGFSLGSAGVRHNNIIQRTTDKREWGQSVYSPGSVLARIQMGSKCSSTEGEALLTVQLSFQPDVVLSLGK